MSLNRVTLVGNLGKDPELRYTQNQKPVCKFSVATTEKREGKQDETDWHTVIVWGQAAANAPAKFKKGDTVYLEGKMKTRKWEDKQKVTHWTTEIHTFYVSKIDRNKPAATQQPGATEAAQPEGDGFDSIPF